MDEDNMICGRRDCLVVRIDEQTAKTTPNINEESRHS
jgi:hypothetical protein